MKAKIAIVTLVGISACTLALAQNEPAAAESVAPVTESTAPAVAEAAPPTESAAPASEVAAPAASTSADVIPLIQFQDVPLTTAIDNLARQAGINYILDPKVGYGQPDDRGVIKTQPNISIRWENITAEQALGALINTYGLQLATDTKTGITRVTIKDPAAAEPLITKVIQLKFASPSNTVAAVSTVLNDKRSKVIADVRTSQLVVSATEKEQEAVAKLVEQIDLQTKQVLIEAKIMETTLSPKTSKGIDWSGTLGAQRFSFGNGAVGGVPPSSTPIFNNATPAVQVGVQNDPGTLGGILGSAPGVLMNDLNGKFGFNPGAAFLNADGVSAVLSFLNESGDTKVVSEPRMVTLDNQKATIDVGLLYPIVNVSASTANTTGGSQINYTNLTINLDVTPRIAANNYIELQVAQGILRLGPTFASTVAGEQNVVDSFLTRTLDTRVMIPSGNTLVMGGLIQDENRTKSTKVPILGDIPGLGFFFRKETKELDRQNLTIFITPTVVEDNDFQPAKSTYLQTTGNEVVKEDWSWWDSGKTAEEIRKQK